MKEDLLRLLNIKLKYIDDNIDALNSINEKLNVERENLNYYERILHIFGDGESEYDVNKLVEVDRENFDKVLEVAGDSLKGVFSGGSCNYEGLVYLINGINSGVPLSLTDEQNKAIHSFISGVEDIRIQNLARIDGIVLAKSKLDSDDVDALEKIKSDYVGTIHDLENEKYIMNIDIVSEAFDYSDVSLEERVNLLSYLLNYNGDIYKSKMVTSDYDEDSDDVLNNIISEGLEIPIDSEETSIDEKNEEFSEDTSLDENVDVNIDEAISDFNSFGNLSGDDYLNEEIPEVSIDNDFSDLVEPDNYEEENNDLEALPVETDDLDSLSVDENSNLDLVDNNDLEALPIEEGEEDLPVENISSEVVDDNEKIVEDDSEKNIAGLENLNQIFGNHKIKFNLFSDDEKNTLLKGNLDNYDSLIAYLEDKKILALFLENKNLFINYLLHSNSDVVDNIITIVNKKLSVDEEDAKETLKIVIKSLPSIFVNEPFGNYEKFINNIGLFNTLKLDLITLFDFSREIFVCDTEVLKNNYRIANAYKLHIDENNAKYLLMLSNLNERIDYYVEASVNDNIKNLPFDGLTYIKNNFNKLGTVSDVTIKRLHYSSENNKKVLGSKENSLAGEITNLKVDVLNISDEYMRNFLNNDFDFLTMGDFSKYEKLIIDSKPDFTLNDDLNVLNKYRDDLRYSIEGILISVNKVSRVYNALKDAGLGFKKTLLLALCYNLVITKEQYASLKKFVSGLGDE